MSRGRCENKKKTRARGLSLQLVTVRDGLTEDQKQCANEN
jgi:hypothetical protein